MIKLTPGVGLGQKPVRHVINYIEKENNIVSRTTADGNASVSFDIQLSDSATEDPVAVNIYKIPMPGGDVVAYALKP